MSYKNWRWKFACIDAYEGLESVKGWKKCKGCGEFPRVWIFDNGRNAKCCCVLEKYSKPQAKAESIMSVHNRNNGNVSEYDRDSLRLAWNRYVETGEYQNTLPQGQW